MDEKVLVIKRKVSPARGASLSRELRLRLDAKATEVPPFANGWYQLLRSSQVKRGAVRYVTALGLELAVWRTESGVLCVSSASCPHLGSNLATNGKVVADLLVCPFHGWRFDSQGHCRHIPSRAASRDGREISLCPPGSLPPSTHLHRFLSIERFGLIFFRYEGGGAPSEEDDWTVRSVAGVKGYRLRAMATHGVQTHFLIGLGFRPLEGAASIGLGFGLDPMPHPTPRSTSRIVALLLDAVFKFREGFVGSVENGKELVAQCGLCINLFGWMLPLGIQGSLRHAGPGLSLLHLQPSGWLYKLLRPVLGTRRPREEAGMLLLQTRLPLGVWSQKVCHFAFAGKAVPDWLCKALFARWMSQLEATMERMERSDAAGDAEALDPLRRWLEENHFDASTATFAEAWENERRAGRLEW
uniref:Rieske domain-containing protein n=1 Tax=Pinguiococcus pyrenoidosus TaxID=172671 RepID=A0A7R9YDA2_9STRA|eukprot:scaffold1638_cov258-Pinguiococcus_pyrenoidosus.AAC.69